MAKRRRSDSAVTKTTSGINLETLKKYAAAGAAATLAKLREEVQIIERTFPELSTSKGIAKLTTSTGKSARSMSAAARKAVSARMKKYWAERRKSGVKAKK